MRRLFVCLFAIFITLNFCFVFCVNANYLTSNNFVSLTLERITGVIQSFFYKPLSLSIKSSTLPKIATGSPLGTTAELCCNNLFVYVCVHACVLASVCAQFQKRLQRSSPAQHHLRLRKNSCQLCFITCRGTFTAETKTYQEINSFSFSK